MRSRTLQPRAPGRRISRAAQRSAKTALLVIAVLLIAGLIPLSHPLLTERAETLLLETGIDTCSIGRIVVTLWKGATARDVYVGKRLSDTSRVEFESRRVNLTFRPLYILTNREAFRGAFEKLFPPKRPIPPPARPGYRRQRGRSGACLFPALRRVSTDGAAMRLLRRGTELARCDGLSVGASIGGTMPLSAKLRANADTLRSGIWHVERLSMGGRLNEGILGIDRVRGRFYGGRVSGKVVLDMEAKAVVDAVVRVDGADLNRLYSSRPRRKGTLSGRADFAVDFERSRWEPDSLAATGTFDLADVTTDTIPVLASIVVMLAVPQLSRLDFDRIRGDLALGQGVLTCKNVDGTGRPVDLESSGWIMQGGELEFEVACTFHREYADSISSLAWNALIPDDNGRRRFECTISGTFDRPRISISSQIRRRAVRNVFENIRRDFKSALKR